MARRSPRLLGRFLLAIGAATLMFGSLPAAAGQHAVLLGTAASFAVLGGSAVTNTGPSVIDGNLGVSPGTAITGFPPGTVNGTIHSADATAAQAQADTTTAYNDAAGRTPFTAVATELGGRTLTSGVYRNTTLGLTGTLTLDAEGDPNAVFIFQAGSTLITASASRVALINGAQACNVFWQIGSSATLGTTTEFVGTVLAQTSITANNGATVQGRLLARTGAVTLDNNRITRSTCAAAAVTTTTAAPTTTTTAAPTTTTAPPSPDGTPTTVAPGVDTGTGLPTPGGTGTGTGAGPGTGTGPAAPAGSTGSGADQATGRTSRPRGAGDPPDRSLPRTGSELTTIGMVGGLAVLLGTAIVQRTRLQPQGGGLHWRGKHRRRRG